MSSKRISSIDDDSEKCVFTADSNLIDTCDNSSDSSNIVFPVRKRPKQLITEDDTDDEDNNINHQLSERWFWKEENNKPKIWKYTQTPGIRVAILDQLGESKRELDVFDIIFDNVFWENIVTETNRYAEQTIINENERRKIDESWTPVDRNEIKIYFALCIIMAQVKKPKIQMNWSKRAVIETPIFGKTMPLQRFLQITRFLHFSNNDTADNMNKFRKVHPVINFFNKKFKEVYVMEEDIAIYESLMKFKGRVSSKQFNSSKRTRFGIKFSKLCESATSYCYDFQIYSGNDETNPDNSASENVVMKLSQSVLHEGHTLYLDDRYSSPELFLTLAKNKTNAVGMVHTHRKNMPRDFIMAKLKKGECRMRSCNGILALKWKDKRDIHIISTKHETVEMTEQYGCRLNPIFKPRSVVDYNVGMIGIDRQDRILACFPVMRKHMKGYRKIFFYIFDMALFNSYILYKKVNIVKKQNYTEYRLEIADALLKNVPSQDYKTRGQLANGDTPMRLHAQHWGHFPKHIDSTPLKQRPSRACKVCTKNKKRSETTWECKKCRVALHVPYCFEKYHTVEDF